MAKEQKGMANDGMLFNDSAARINQQAQTVYPGGIAAFLSSVPDAVRTPTPTLGPNLAASAAPVGMSPQSQGLLTGIRDYSTTPAQLANSGRPAFVNEDGSARNMGPVVPPVAQPPLMTMKERDIAAGLDPGRAYRPGSAADPHASGNVNRAAAPASPFATDQQYSSPFQPLDTRSRRQRRQAGFADGGMVQFAGKGGPREDQIPVTVAGEHIRVSDGEAAVILPAKTAANTAALGIIGQLIKATNDGRAPKMGIYGGEEYQRGALPVRQYPDEIDIARGLMETENARAADAAARAKAARAGAVVPVAAPEPYRPNWTQPRNIPAQFAPPVVEGVVETVADQRAARMASQPRALNAPTNIVPPVSQPNWTAGGNPPNVGPIGGGQWANQGWSNPPERATMPQRGGIQSAVQALPGPAPELMKASSDARTAAGAKAAGMASKEAAAYANRPAFETSPLANVRQNAALAGKVVKRVIPAVGGSISAANIADVATAKNKTGQDVATQVAREAGGLGSAVAGGALGAKAGAALGALGGPMAPITVPAGALLGGIAGGLAANYGANKLMDLGGEAPAETSNGVVTQLFGGNEQAAVDPVRAKHNEILNSGSAAGSIKLPITQSDKRAAFANTDAARRAAFSNTDAASNEESGSVIRNGVVQTNMGRGFDPTKLNMADGYGMASNAAGKTMIVSPSQYIAADGSPTSRWEDTQAYKDAIARNEADKMRLAEMQSLRLGADPMAIQSARQGIASAVLGNQAKEAEMRRNDQLQSLLAKASATTDPEQHKLALQNYLAARGINPRESDEWEIKDGGQYTVPNGMGGVQVVNRGPIAFNKKTQRWIAPDGRISQGAADGVQQQVTVGMPVNAADGDDYTYQGKTIVVKNGKVVEIK